MKLFNFICEFLAKLIQNPSQFRRSETAKEAKQISLEIEREKNFIICNEKELPIEWDDVILFDSPAGFSLPKNCYKKAKTERVPTMFVSHWDVCLSSKSCFNVLKKRKLSVHFLIDNDGTIYQIMDCNDIGYHAGNWKVNTKSVGVEISNAYYPKYQDIYRSKGFGPRPMWKDVEVHDRTLEPFLGFYSRQEQAFQALTKALHNAYGIPLETPMKDNEPIRTVVPKVVDGTFKGVINHYHITERKIDCAGFDLNEVLAKII